MSKAQKHLDAWLSHRLVLLELLDKVADEYVHFKPAETSMPLSQLAIHVATAGDRFVQAVKTGTMPPSEKRTAETMEEVRSIVREITERNREEIAALTDDQLSATVSTKHVFGTDFPGSALLTIMKDHEIHHKGQLFVYVRMTGVTDLPLYVRRAK